MDCMPKTYFSLVVQAKNYICPALIFMSNPRMSLKYTVVSGKWGSFSCFKVMTFKYLKQGQCMMKSYLTHFLCAKLFHLKNVILSTVQIILTHIVIIATELDSLSIITIQCKKLPRIFILKIFKSVFSKMNLEK